MVTRSMSKSTKTPEDLKLRLAKKIPKMLTSALKAYDQIVKQPAAEDPKAFTAQQSGAKAALSHIDALLKLAQSTMEGGDAIKVSEGENQLDDLMVRARNATAKCDDLPEEDGDQIGGDLK